MFNVWKSQFQSIWLGMIWIISVSEVKFLRLSSGSLDSFDDSSESSSVNHLSYHQCSYSWFDRVDLLLILEIWSLSLGLVFRSFFLIWCSEILESLSFLILSFFWRCKSFPLHRSLFVIYFFYKKDLWRFFSLTFWSV